MGAVLEGGKVSNRQATLLLPITVIIATSVLFVPSITAASAKQDGWLSLLVVGTAYGLLVALVVTILGLRFPHQTVVEYAPSILGIVPGKLVGAAYLFWFLHVNAVIVREFGDYLLTAFMPETPLLAFNIILLLLGAVAVKSGLEVICRANEFVIPLFFLALIAIVVLVFRDADWSNLLPLLEGGVKPVLRGGVEVAAWRGEIVIILMLIPYLNQPHLVGRHLALAVIFVGLVLALVTALTTAVLGGLVEHFTFPTHSLARYILVGQFIERMEVLTLVMWVAGETIKVAAYYYVAALAAGQLFGLQDYRPLVLPLGMISAVWSQSLFANSRELVAWLSGAWPPYAYTFELLLPALLLLVAVLRRKGGSPHGS